MGVKPILTADYYGAQTPMKKVRGRQTSLREIVALLKDPSRKYVPLSDEGIAGFERYRAERELLAPGKGRMAVV